MSYHLTDQAEGRVFTAVSTASTTFGIQHPGVVAEVLDGPEGSALHIKVTVPASVQEQYLRPLASAIRNAALAALPELPSIPFVTILRQRA